MAAKHPPTYDCTLCNRSYHAPFALEDHYRGSPAHPNCGRCGRGFRDAPACEEVLFDVLFFLPSVFPDLNSSNYQHHRTAHPKAPCLPCGGRIFYEDALDQHYLESVNHPSCIPCSAGFEDDIAYAEVNFPSQSKEHLHLFLFSPSTYQQRTQNYNAWPAVVILKRQKTFKSISRYRPFIRNVMIVVEDLKMTMLEMQ